MTTTFSLVRAASEFTNAASAIGAQIKQSSPAIQSSPNAATPTRTNQRGTPCQLPSPERAMSAASIPIRAALITTRAIAGCATRTATRNFRFTAELVHCQPCSRGPRRAPLRETCTPARLILRRADSFSSSARKRRATTSLRAFYAGKPARHGLIFGYGAIDVARIREGLGRSHSLAPQCVLRAARPAAEAAKPNRLGQSIPFAACDSRVPTCRTWPGTVGKNG